MLTRANPLMENHKTAPVQRPHIYSLHAKKQLYARERSRETLRTKGGKQSNVSLTKGKLQMDLQRANQYCLERQNKDDE